MNDLRNLAQKVMSNVAKNFMGKCALQSTFYKEKLQHKLHVY